MAWHWHFLARKGRLQGQVTSYKRLTWSGTEPNWRMGKIRKMCVCGSTKKMRFRGGDCSATIFARCSRYFADSPGRPDACCICCLGSDIRADADNGLHVMSNFSQIKQNFEAPLQKWNEAWSQPRYEGHFWWSLLMASLACAAKEASICVKLSKRQTLLASWLSDNHSLTHEHRFR